MFTKKNMIVITIIAIFVMGAVALQAARITVHITSDISGNAYDGDVAAYYFGGGGGTCTQWMDYDGPGIYDDFVWFSTNGATASFASVTDRGRYVEGFGSGSSMAHIYLHLPNNPGIPNDPPTDPNNE